MSKKHNREHEDVHFSQEIINTICEKIVYYGCRPLEYGPMGVQRILELMRDEGYKVPHYTNFWRWLNNDEELQRQVMQAIHAKDVAVFEQIEDIIASSKKDDYYREGDEVYKDNDGKIYANNANIKRQELLAKLNIEKLKIQAPRKYGHVKDKIALEQHEEIKQQQKEINEKLNKLLDDND